MAEVVQGYAALQARFRAVTGVGSASLMNQIGLATVREAKLLVHRKTGNLGRSIRVVGHIATSVQVAATANYAAYVELGTRPHEITPKAAQALRFAASPAGRRLTGSPRIGADVVFAMRVHHPGTKPYPFLVPGAVNAIHNAGAQAIVAAWDGAA